MISLEKGDLSYGLKYITKYLKKLMPDNFKSLVSHWQDNKGRFQLFSDTSKQQQAQQLYQIQDGTPKLIFHVSKKSPL